jgi:hypothetical protein
VRADFSALTGFSILAESRTPGYFLEAAFFAASSFKLPLYRKLS